MVNCRKPLWSAYVLGSGSLCLCRHVVAFARAKARALLN